MRYNEKDYGSKFTLLPEGKYKFQIKYPPEAHKKNKVLMFLFKLNATPEGEKESKYATVWVVVWEAGAIWRALGYEKDDEDGWDVDLDNLVGQEFFGSIVHEPSRKDHTKVYGKIRNVVIPDNLAKSNEEEPQEVSDEEIPF